MISNIPQRNLAVGAAEFAALWSQAEHLGHRPATTPTGNHYLTAVIDTCRWLYTHPLPTGPCGRETLTPAPYTHHRDGVTPETIDREYATVLSVESSRPPNRIRYAHGVIATLDWACNGNGHNPLKGLTQAATG